MTVHSQSADYDSEAYPMIMASIDYPIIIHSMIMSKHSLSNNSREHSLIQCSISNDKGNIAYLQIIIY